MLQLLLNGILLGSVYALVALAFSLNMGILGVLNIAIAQMLLVGALVSKDLLDLNVPFALVLFGAVALGALLGWVLERVGYRPVDKRDAITTLLTTVAFGLILENLVEVRWGTEANYLPEMSFDKRLELGPVAVSVIQLLSLAVTVVLVAVLASFLQRSSLGRTLRAVSQKRGAAVALGLRVRRAEVATFLIAGALAGAAGLLLGLNYGVVSISFGMTIGISGIAAMILGGVDNLWGSVVAGPILGLTYVLSTSWLGANYSNLFVFGLLALILVVRPQGILGSTDKSAGRV